MKHRSRQLPIFILAALAVTLLFAGSCDKPYLPWVSNPWPSSGDEAPAPRAEPTPQAPLEGFCEDMRESIDDYRTYLEDENLTESRRRNIRGLVEQYDRECVDDQS